MEIAFFALLVAVFYWGLEQVGQHWRLWFIRYLNWRSSRKTVELPECALCGYAESFVEHLVAGEKGAVCFRCVRMAVSELDRVATRRGELPASGLAVFADLLSTKARKLEPSIRSRLIDALAVPSGSAAHREHLTEILTSGDVPEGVVAILRKLPASQWSDWDFVRWAWASCRIGDFKAALKAPVAPKAVLGEGVERRRSLYLLEARIETASTDVEIEKCRAEIEEFRQSLNSVEYPIDPNIHVQLHEIDILDASCLLRLGMIDEAEVILIRRRQLSEDMPELSLLWGDVLAAKGRNEDAVQAWKAAILDAGGITRERLGGRLRHNQMPG